MSKSLGSVIVGAAICGLVSGIGVFILVLAVNKIYNLRESIGDLFFPTVDFILGVIIGGIVGYLRPDPLKTAIVIGIISFLIQISIFAITFKLSAYDTISQDRHDLFFCLGQALILTFGAWLAALAVSNAQPLDKLSN